MKDIGQKMKDVMDKINEGKVTKFEHLTKEEAMLIGITKETFDEIVYGNE